MDVYIQPLNVVVKVGNGFSLSLPLHGGDFMVKLLGQPSTRRCAAAENALADVVLQQQLYSLLAWWALLEAHPLILYQGLAGATRKSSSFLPAGMEFDGRCHRHILLLAVGGREGKGSHC